MFKRFFWLTVGLGIGYGTSFWLMRTVRRTVERLTPERLGRDVVAGARSFGAEVRAAVEDGRAAMREREAELRAQLDRRVR
ncbi:MAG: hypothetical protein M3326_04905 [Actinomycetota bacterium]|nr:hypothetical protein [Actinomycetota bacterium]